MVASMGKPEMALEHRQADALGDHLHVGIEDGAAEVEALADDVVVRRLDHGQAHCLGGRVERGPDDAVIGRRLALGERCSLPPTPPIASAAFS